MSATSASVPVWDLPLRLFHWLLLAAVATAIATGIAGGDWMTWHGRAGLAIVGLLVFRVVWGLIGSATSRFSHFFPTPARLRAYLQGAWHGVGHNPLGAFSVFALLGLLGVQVGTGLFSNDDIAFAGPLATFIDEELVSSLTGWHHWLINLLYALIALHVLAIVFYTVVKRERLVPAMVTGRKPVHADAHRSDTQTAQTPQGTSPARLWALVVAVALAALAVWGASAAWYSAPAPVTPTAVDTPAW